MYKTHIYFKMDNVICLHAAGVGGNGTHAAICRLLARLARHSSSHLSCCTNLFTPKEGRLRLFPAVWSNTRELRKWPRQDTGRRYEEEEAEGVQVWENRCNQPEDTFIDSTPRVSTVKVTRPRSYQGQQSEKLTPVFFSLNNVIIICNMEI